MTIPPRTTLWVLAVLASGCAGRCGARGGLPPELPPLVKGPDGQVYHVLDRGPYKAFYDRWGRLQRLEYDSNGDGRADLIAHHDGSRTARTIEVDENFDGRIDRWEDYDPAARLVKVGTSRRGGRPDAWVFPGPDGLPMRKEYDEDGDGRVDRAEVLRDGRVVRVEVDTDRDGRFDRWQDWASGRLAREDVDTDRDGRPDRRILYGERGRVVALEAIAQH